VVEELVPSEDLRLAEERFVCRQKCLGTVAGVEEEQLVERADFDSVPDASAAGLVARPPLLVPAVAGIDGVN